VWTAISIIGCTVGGGLIGAASGIAGALAYIARVDPRSYQMGYLEGNPLFYAIGDLAGLQVIPGLWGAAIGMLCGGLLGAFVLGRAEK